MKKSTVIIMWGVITSLVNIVFSQTVMNVASNPNSGIQWIGWVIILAGLIVGTLQYRKANGGYLTFGQGYVAGILMSLIIAVFSTISFFIFLQMHPDYPQKIIEQSRIQWVNKGMTQEQIDLALSYSRRFINPTMMMIFGFFGGILGGAILSLISAGVNNKPKPLIDNDDNSSVQ